MRKALITGAAALALTLAAAYPAAPASAPASAQDKAAPANPFIVLGLNVTRLSEHVWEIPDNHKPGNPNIAIVVGTRATLIVDTGMGPRSGEAVVREAQKLSRNTQFYLVTTDFRPEHMTGAMSLPPGSVYIVPRAQKVDIHEQTQTYITNFTSRSADLAEALKGVKIRDPDITFDREAKVDLGGGVIVHLLWYGPALFNGDVAVFVEPDRLLHGGNFLNSKTYPSMPAHTADVNNWLDVLDKLEALHPLIVLPNHGDVRDATIIPNERLMLRDLQRRALELKSEGVTAEQAAQTLVAEFDVKYPDWKNPGNIAGIVRRFYAAPK